MRLIQATTILAFSLAAGQVGAQDTDGALWMQGLFNTDQGTTYTLSYAIPQTDAWQFSATCEAGSIGPEIPVMLALNFADRPNGAPVTVNFQTGSLNGSYAGSVSIQNEEFAGILVNIGNQDPLWTALFGARSLTIRSDTGDESTIPLNGVGAPLKRFLSKCKANFAQAGAAAPAQISGPFTYQCENGKTFQASFDNSRSNTIAHILAGGHPLELHQVESGSGAKFVNEAEGLTLHTKGDLAVFTSGHHQTTCHTIGQ